MNKLRLISFFKKNCVLIDKEPFIMYVFIPNKINIDHLLKKLSLSKTRKRNLKDKIAYFLSLLTRTNDNVDFIYDLPGYKKVCSCIQKKIHGNADYYKIIEILESSDQPIIEKNKKWKKGNRTKGVCQGYRIIQNIDDGNTRKFKINNALVKRLDEVKTSEIRKTYKFLTDQFKKHEITIDDKVYDYLNSYYNKLKTKANDNQYQILILKNHVGRWLEKIEKIKNKELWSKVSNTNHRLNSTFTSLPKELRKFILINNNQLESIDIKSCQPYILSSLIENRIYLETEKGYNIKTIYPELHERIIKSINETNKFYHNNSIINKNSPYLKTSDRTYLYMWYEFLSKNESESLIKFSQFNFNDDFYMDIIKNNTNNISNYNVKNIHELRKKLKDVMMLILFDDNFKNRNNNHYMNLFKEVYPGVNTWIEKTHNLIGKQEFAYLLQRTESFLMLNNVCRELNKKHKNAPIFTIHDAVYTTKEYIDDLSIITQEKLRELTNKNPGIKHSIEYASTIPEDEEINSRWERIRHICTKKQFNKIEHTILNHNLLLAENFLNSKLF